MGGQTEQVQPGEQYASPFFASTGMPVLFGGIVVVSYKQREYMNAAILASPQGTVLDTYGKMHPVPFAESIPFFEYPAGPDSSSATWSASGTRGSWEPGTRSSTSPCARAAPCLSASRSASRTPFPNLRPGIHPARRRHAGEHHQRFLVQDLVVGDPALPGGAVPGHREPAACSCAPPTAGFPPWSGPGGRSGCACRSSSARGGRSTCPSTRSGRSPRTPGSGTGFPRL